MKIRPITIDVMVERARQTYNKRHSFNQIPAGNKELADRIHRQLMWEDIIERVTRKIKWTKSV